MAYAHNVHSRPSSFFERMHKKKKKESEPTAFTPKAIEAGTGGEKKMWDRGAPVAMVGEGIVPTVGLRDDKRMARREVRRQGRAHRALHYFLLFDFF